MKLPASLVANPPLDLWPTVARRCELTADVAQLLCEDWCAVGNGE
jgi:hypothetical protein